MTFLALQLTSPDFNLWLILPELVICIAGVAVMLVDAFAKPTQRWITSSISIAGFFAAAGRATWLCLSWRGASQAFNGMIALDELLLRFTLVFLVVFCLT